MQCVVGWDVPHSYFAPDEPTADEDSFWEMVEERMSYPHQPGSPSFEGGAAYEAYCDELDRNVSQSQLRHILSRFHPGATEAQLFDCVSQILAHMNKPRATPGLTSAEHGAATE